jgi:hypothetical protein
VSPIEELFFKNKVVFLAGRVIKKYEIGVIIEESGSFGMAYNPYFKLGH